MIAKRLLIFFISLFSLFYLSECTREEFSLKLTSEEYSTNDDSLSSIIQWVNGRLTSSLRSDHSILSNPPSYRFKAIGYRGKFKSLDVDLTDVFHFDLITEESFEYLKINPEDWKYYHSTVRMVILLNRQTEERSVFFMALLPSREYINTRYMHLPENTYFKMDSLYDGKVIYFDIDGKPICGRKYSQGEMVQRYLPIMSNISNSNPVSFTTKSYRSVYLVSGISINSYPKDEEGRNTLPEVVVIGHRHEKLWEWIDRVLRKQLEMDWEWRDASNSGNEPLPDGGGGENEDEAGDEDQEKLKDPCENMKSKSGNKTFMNELNKLKGLVSGPKEYGRAFVYDSNYFTFSTHDGEPNKIDAYLSHPIDGFIHTHNLDREHWPIFTAEDLFSIYHLYQAGYIRNIETYTLALVTKHGYYFLKVTDVDAFKKFFSSNTNPEDFNYILVTMYKVQNSHQEALDNFVYFLKNIKSGMVLLEWKNDSFQQKTIVNGKITNVKC